MLNRRRLMLQLTPLLDLLLIVMFSQYIENRDRTVANQRELQTRRAELESELGERKSELEREFADNRRTIDELRATYDQRFRSIMDQHHQIGSLLAESLNLPGATITEILKLRTSGAEKDAERLTAATEHLRDLMQARGADVFRFLLKVDEMQKHVSVWEIHVQNNGQARISDSDQSFLADFASQSDFIGGLFEASKSFADPRTLVIILLTWGGDAQGGARQMALDAMPLLTEKLRRDSAGTTWYDFSIVGYRVEGPVFSGLPNPQP